MRHMGWWVEGWHSPLGMANGTRWVGSAPVLAQSASPLLSTAPCCREAGVEAARSFHTHVRMNGKYYGKFAFTEQFDKDTLKVRRAGALAGGTRGRMAHCLRIDCWVWLLRGRVPRWAVGGM